MFIARVMKEADAPFSEEAALVPHIWSALTSAMMAEVHSGATGEQARKFFGALGERIAAMQPVDDIEDLNMLCERINLLWAHLGWGTVDMTLNDGGIDLRHEDVPAMPASLDDGHWWPAVGAILEGAYDHWFRCLGSCAKLHTRVIQQTEGDFELRHAP